MNSETINTTLAEFAIETQTGRIAERARQIARLSMLDWLAVGLAGCQEPVSQIVRNLAIEEGGSEQASVFGSSQQFPARAAALVNGTISHALDYDDTHFIHIGHPSVAVMPAALAIGQRMDLSLEDCLDAALLGMEAACRLGSWLGRSHYDIGFHQTATSGTIGATVAAARLLKMNVQQTQHALGLAATRTSGLKCQFGTMGKPYHAGMAAANGVEVALLAASGFVSRPDALDCEQGLAWTHHGTRQPNAFDGLGDIYVFEQVQHKFHACCHGTHAALEALIQARDDHQLNPAEIKQVSLDVHPSWLKVCNIQSPKTGLEAKFSYRLTTAMALHRYDTAAISTFTDDLCNDNTLLGLCERVSVTASDEINETQAQIRVSTDTAEDITVHYDLSAPMDYSQREEKVKAKAQTLLGTEKADQFWAAINNAGPLKTVGTLMAD